MWSSPSLRGRACCRMQWGRMETRRGGIGQRAASGRGRGGGKEVVTLCHCDSVDPYLVPHANATAQALKRSRLKAFVVPVACGFPGPAIIRRCSRSASLSPVTLSYFEHAQRSCCLTSTRRIHCRTEGVLEGIHHRLCGLHN